ncbi:MAG: ABC transporter ATP-binding protein [Pseudomonadota bacterium]
MENSPTLSIIARVAGENARDHMRNYSIAGVCLIIIAATTAYTAWIISRLVDEVYVDKNLSTAYTIALIVLGVFLIKGAATYTQDVLLKRVAHSIVARYQRRIYQHMTGLGVGYYHATRSAYLVGQINQNIQGVKDLLNLIITVLLRDLLSVIGLVFVMVYRDPLLSTMAFLIAPPLIILVNNYKKRVKRIAREGVDLNARVASAMQETAQGITIVKAFTMEEQLTAKVQTLVSAAEERANKMARIIARTSPIMETLAGLAVAAVIAYGGYRIIVLDGSAGDMMSFLTAFLLAYEPAKRLARLNVNLEKQLVDARMIYEVLDAPRRQSDPEGAPDFEFKNGEVRFDSVNFSYNSGSEGAEPVISDLNCVAEAGKTTALVGPSGGGKSTIIALLQRFFDIQSGVILVDGQDISKIRISSLREKIAYVSQQPILFEGTIRENLLYARPDATQDEIEAATNLAQAHNFISELPLGYDTPVGENGVTLSGGQRQRLSIARAVLRNAPILLLDEATSALDNESEALVQRALDDLMVGRTTIVIAHRLSTIAQADNIIVIDNGTVVDQGNHEELVKRNEGIYARFHELGQGAVSAAEDQEEAEKVPVPAG